MYRYSTLTITEKRMHTSSAPPIVVKIIVVKLGVRITIFYSVIFLIVANQLSFLSWDYRPTRFRSIATS